MSEASKTHELGKHYHFDFGGIRLDPYRIISVYKHIIDPEHQHAVKKLLRAGQGKAKSLDQDIEGVILTLQCWQRRRKEDKESPPTTPDETGQPQNPNA